MMRFGIIIFISLITLNAFAASLNEIQLLRILTQEERAVIKTPDGKTQTIKVGDPIGESARVIEITEGRVVIEEKTKTGMETVIIRLDEKGQRVERMRKTIEETPFIDAPGQQGRK